MPSESKRELPVELQHDDEHADERDDRAENVGEALVVDRLDGLRIVGDAKARISRAARVVILERERLQVRVEIGAQLEERLQADLHEDVIGGEVDQSPQTSGDRPAPGRAGECSVASRMCRSRNAEFCGRIWSTMNLNGHGLSKIHPDADEREEPDRAASAPRKGR